MQKKRSMASGQTGHYRLIKHTIYDILTSYCQEIFVPAARSENGGNMLSLHIPSHAHILR